MTVRIIVSPDAEKYLASLQSWWRRNRTAAASQVTQEMVRVRALLQSNPDIGNAYRRRGLKNIRSLRLKKTPYNLYYHHAPGSDLITILGVWSSMKRRAPPLKMP